MDKKLAIFKLSKLIMQILFISHVIGCFFIVVAKKTKNPHNWLNDL